MIKFNFELVLKKLINFITYCIILNSTIIYTINYIKENRISSMLKLEKTKRLELYDKNNS